MKTKEELDVLKEELKNLNKKLTELSAEELKQVSGGMTEQELTEKARTTVLNGIVNDWVGALLPNQ